MVPPPVTFGIGAFVATTGRGPVPNIRGRAADRGGTTTRTGTTSRKASWKMSSAHSSDESIMIVDDDRDFREALAEILRGAGYSTAVFGNGSEAFRFLQKNPPPKLILLNLMMPVMNGWAFMAEKQRVPGLREVPVLLLSGMGDLPEQAEVLKAAGYLTKPVEVGHLLDTIDGLMPNGH
jgi:two-component system chemotaxis response regulator CheY